MKLKVGFKHNHIKWMKPMPYKVKPKPNLKLVQTINLKFLKLQEYFHFFFFKKLIYPFSCYADIYIHHMGLHVYHIQSQRKSITATSNYGIASHGTTWDGTPLKSTHICAIRLAHANIPTIHTILDIYYHSNYTQEFLSILELLYRNESTKLSHFMICSWLKGKLHG